jgi:hypothetical protein
MIPPLIYVAGPYSAPTKDAVSLNIAAARHVGRLMVQKGWMPVIPHGNTYHFDELIDMPQSFWLSGTLNLMEQCDAVVLVDGWELSTGARGERQRALELRMPLYDTAYKVPRTIDFVRDTSAINRKASTLLQYYLEYKPLLTPANAGELFAILTTIINDSKNNQEDGPSC